MFAPLNSSPPYFSLSSIVYKQNYHQYLAARNGSQSTTSSPALSKDLFTSSLSSTLLPNEIEAKIETRAQRLAENAEKKPSKNILKISNKFKPPIYCLHHSLQSLCNPSISLADLIFSLDRLLRSILHQPPDTSFSQSFQPTSTTLTPSSAKPSWSPFVLSLNSHSAGFMSWLSTFSPALPFHWQFFRSYPFFLYLQTGVFVGDLTSSLEIPQLNCLSNLLARVTPIFFLSVSGYSAYKRDLRLKVQKKKQQKETTKPQQSTKKKKMYPSQQDYHVFLSATIPSLFHNNLHTLRSLSFSYFPSASMVSAGGNASSLFANFCSLLTQFSCLESFSFHHTPLSPSECNSLCESLQKMEMPLQSFTLSSCSITIESISCIIRLLNRQKEKRDENDWKNNLRNSTSNPNEQQYQQEGSWCFPRLRTINLTYNQISEQGIVRMLQEITYDDGLKCVLLHGNINERLWSTASTGTAVNCSSTISIPTESFSASDTLINYPTPPITNAFSSSAPATLVSASEASQFTAPISTSSSNFSAISASDKSLHTALAMIAKHNRQLLCLTVFSEQSIIKKGDGVSTTREPMFLNPEISFGRSEEKMVQSDAILRAQAGRSAYSSQTSSKSKVSSSKFNDFYITMQESQLVLHAIGVGGAVEKNESAECLQEKRPKKPQKRKIAIATASPSSTSKPKKKPLSNSRIKIVRGIDSGKSQKCEAESHSVKQHTKGNLETEPMDDTKSINTGRAQNKAVSSTNFFLKLQYHTNSLIEATTQGKMPTQQTTRRGSQVKTEKGRTSYPQSARSSKGEAKSARRPFR